MSLRSRSAAAAVLLLLGACGTPRSQVSIDTLTAEGSAYRSPDKQGGAVYLILNDIHWAPTVADAAPDKGA